MSLAIKSFSIFQRDVLLFVTNLVTGIIVARILGPAALGIWMILTLVPSYAEALGRLKVDAAAVYLIGQRLFRREDILFNTNVIAIASAAVLVVAVLWQFEVLYSFLLGNAEGDFRSELSVLVIQIPLQFLYLNYRYFHLAEENVRVYNRMVVIQAWSQSIIAISLLTLTGLGLWSVIIAAIASVSLGLAYGWLSIDRSSWVRGRWNGTLNRQMILYGSHFYLTGVLAQLHEIGTRTIAVAFLASTQIAFLGQAQGIGKILHKVTDALNTILFPRISRSGSDDAAAVSCTAFRISAIMLTAGGMVLAGVAEPLITFLYGVEFKPTARVLHYLLPGLVVGGVCGTLANYFNGTGRAKLIPRIQAVPLAIQLVLAWVLLQRWGLHGAAAALSTGLAVYGIALCIVFVKVSGTPVRNLLPQKSDIRYLYGFGVQTLVKWKLISAAKS